MIAVPTVWFGLQFYWQNKTKALYAEAQDDYCMKYAYTVAKGSVNQTMYAKNKEEGIRLLKYYRELSDYYDKVRAGEITRVKSYSFSFGDSVYNIPISIPIPIRYIAVGQEVYVRCESMNDSVVMGYVFNTDCWGFFKAYVPSDNLFDALPEDSLMEDFRRHSSSLPSSRSSHLYGSPSPYGFYCN
jgi:hypothetical protein